MGPPKARRCCAYVLAMTQARRAWAAHPAARAGKLEKRGKLKDEWKARHFELRGCYLVCFADAKEGRPALAVFDVTKVACARDANDPDDVFGLRVLWPLIISSLCFC